ncbi:MAG: hypothetical protein AAB431_03540, partial [Patescibacteria group bacterium]
MKIEKRRPTETVQDEMLPVSKKQTTKTFPKSVVFLITVVIVLGFLTLLVYQAPLSNPFVRVVTTILPFPAATVDGSVITLH